MKKVWAVKTAVSLVLTSTILLSFALMANATQEQNVDGTSGVAVFRMSDSEVLAETV
jgi:hypothetical protein